MMRLSGVVSYPLCLKFFRHSPLKATTDRPRPAGSGRQSVLNSHCPLEKGTPRMAMPSREWFYISCFWFLVSGCGLSKSKSGSGSGSKSEAYHPGFRFLVSDCSILQISDRFVNFRFRFRYRYRFRSLLPPVKLSAVLDPIRGQECPRSVLFIHCPAKLCSYASGFGAHVRGTWSFRVRMKSALGEKPEIPFTSRNKPAAGILSSHCLIRTRQFHRYRVLVLRHDEIVGCGFLPLMSEIFPA